MNEAHCWRRWWTLDEAGRAWSEIERAAYRAGLIAAYEKSRMTQTAFADVKSEIYLHQMAGEPPAGANKSAFAEVA